MGNNLSIVAGPKKGMDKEAFIYIYKSPLCVLHLILLTVAICLVGSWAVLHYPETTQTISISLGSESAWNLRLPFFGLPVLLIMAVIGHRLLNCRYLIAPDHISSTVGLLSFDKTEHRMELSHIRGIEVHRSLWGRIVNIGDLKIGSAMEAGVEVGFMDINDPSFYRDLLIDHVHKYQSALPKEEEQVERAAQE